MMTKEQITTATPAALLQHVFGRKPGQTLTDFLKEIITVKTDESFIAEVRAYALAQAGS